MTAFADLTSMNRGIRVHPEQRLQSTRAHLPGWKGDVRGRGSTELGMFFVFIFFSPLSTNHPSTTFQPLTLKIPQRQKKKKKKKKHL